MTLILSAVSRSIVLHASDRLITNSKNEAVYDPLANKCILFAARDGIVCLGYTGLAYIDRKPTDEWLAQKLIPHDLESKRSPNGTLPVWCSYETVKWLDVGWVIRTLVEALNRRITTAYLSREQRTWKEHPFAILATGHIWNRRNQNRLQRARPFAVTISKAQGKPFCTVEPNWFRSADSVAGGVFAVPRTKLVNQEIESFCRDSMSLDVLQCEPRIVESVRNVASQSKVVGGTVLSVVIYSPQHRIVVIKLHPIKPHEIAPSDLVGCSQAYMNTPWIIGPSGFAASGTMFGSEPFRPEMRIGHYRFRIEIPVSQPGSPRIAIGPHFRKGPP